MSLTQKIRSLFAPEKKSQFEDVLKNILAAYQNEAAGVTVTPDSSLQSPTVHAIVTAISNRFSTLPVHVYQQVDRAGRTYKEPRPNHPVERLLTYPNSWQTSIDFWQDASSCLTRWGNFYAIKLRGMTGPIRALEPIYPGAVEVKQEDNGSVIYRVHLDSNAVREYTPSQLLHVRGPGKDFIQGDSPVTNCKRAVGLEIAAEKFGASFFANGALPFLVFKHLPGSAGFRTKEEEQEFRNSFERAFGGDSRFRAMLLPKGLEEGKPVPVENDRAQFLETRKLQRQIIAAAFGVPLNVVGSLENSTYNNIEQQSLDFVVNVLLPHVRRFEVALEDALLTTEDINSGHIIRFNIDGALRGDFASRQNGLKVMREAGIINANEWREMENMNPISEEDGGEDYIRPLNMAPPGESPDAGNSDAETSPST